MEDVDASEGLTVVGRRVSTSSAHSSGSESSMPRHMQDMQLMQVHALADFISTMKVTRPEVLRATAAYHAFESCAAALRGDGDFFAKSRAVRKIQEFWSHSWHLSVWAKCLTLLVLINGLAAVVVGNACALLGSVLFQLHVLPGFERIPGEWDDSVWSFALGVTGTMLSLACWRSRRKVFLDRICIDQSGDLQVEAICSLAGILHKSQSMLVLWDSSFTERLWCVFEIAAFLKSNEQRERPLVVCPTLTGPFSFALFATVTLAFIPVVAFPTFLVDGRFGLALPLACFATIGVANAYACCHILRGFYRSIEVMQRQLLSLQVSELKCSCCSTGKCTARGANKAICDKQVIAECIAIWFGSTQDFEEYVQTEVVDVITEQLERRSFGDAWSVALLSPAQWALFDILQYEIRGRDPRWSWVMVWLSLMLSVFLISPMLTSWCKFLAYRLRHESSSRCGEFLTNSLMILYASPVITFGVTAFVIPYILPFESLRAAAVVAFVLPGWALMCLLRRRGKGYLSEFIWQQRLAERLGPKQVRPME